MNIVKPFAAVAGAPAAMFLVLALAGCHDHGKHQAAATDNAKKGPATQSAADKANADIQAERAKLSTEDRKVVDAQEWCVVSDDSRLGSMGAPIKLMVNDQPVFICCKHCEKKAMEDAGKTVAKLDELKAKKSAQAAAK